LKAYLRRVKITQDVRECAAQKKIDEQAALGVGMKDKAEEFVRRVRKFINKRHRRQTALEIRAWVQKDHILELVMKR